ncbi:MAG: MFS transporter [Clostridia bacterium]|nr:MFS transporter [Clostridia bacterium]
MEKQKNNIKPNIRDKKNNARLYPIYKMFSWDLIFYYAIAFVFLVQTKGLSVAEVMLTDALYPIFKVILQIPALAVIDKKGKKKSLIIGNLALGLYLILIILSKNIIHVAIAGIISAFAFAIKNVAEPNLLYDSVTQRKGKGMYAKLDELGARNYYYLDGITSIFTGFLFVVNGYLPIIVSLIFVTISIALTTCFKEIYPINKEKTKTMVARIQEYKEEIKTSFKFIFQSKRLQAIMLFAFVFEGIVYASYTLREGLLNEMKVGAQYFAIIISTLTIVSGMFVALQDIIDKKFKNKALTVMAVVYLFSFILIGICADFINNWWISLILCLVLFALQYAIQSPHHVLLAKYLKSFASAKMRVKIDSAFNLVKSISEFGIAMIASALLSKNSAKSTFLILGIVFFIVMTFVLQWMKPRFGLKAEEYNEKDIKFKEYKK